MTRQRSRFPHRRRAGLAFVVALALVGAACGDDDDDAATNGGDDSAASADAAGSNAADDAGDEAADGETIVVHAVDFAFEDLPDTVEVGTRLSLVNDSSQELHELVAMRIPDGDERSVQEILEDPSSVGDGPPAMVLIAPPGEDSQAVVGDGTFTEPGRYAVICAIPSGVDPEEYLAAAETSGDGPPEIEGAGPPHFVHGMVAELTVE